MLIKFFFLRLMLKLCLVKNKKYLLYKILFSIIKYIILFYFLLEILFLYLIYDVKKKNKKIKMR